MGSLERFLYDVTGVEEAALLAYLSDGQRLRGENVRDLAGAADQVCLVTLKKLMVWLSAESGHIRFQQTLS